MNLSTLGSLLVQSIVITGGPCSGKTSALQLLRDRLACANLAAIFVDEAATSLILEGTTPESCGSMQAFQGKVTALQLQRETKAHQEACATRANLVVCDRGITDGAAYINPRAYTQVLADHGLSVQDALMRYDAVFCLESATALGTDIYTSNNNAARTETAEEAATLAKRTADAWRAHPHFYFIPNADAFEDKAEALLQAIMCRYSA